MNYYDFIIMLVSHIIVLGIGYTIGLKTNVHVSQNVKNMYVEELATPVRKQSKGLKPVRKPISYDLSFFKDEEAIVPDEPKTPEQIVEEMLYGKEQSR